MKITISLSLLFSVNLWAQTFDTYGGWQQSPCSGGSAANFYTEKVGSRWWFCTPSGNHFFFQGVGGTYLSQLIINPVTKYGSNSNWAAEQVNFFKSLKFNAVGELSEPILFANTNTNKVPFIETILQSNYATVNLNNHATRPTKNYMYSVNGYFTGYLGAGCIDSFDPEYSVYATGLYQEPQIAALFASPYFVGMMGDDTDFICGMGASPAFQTILPGHHKGHPGFITLLTSPKQTFDNGFTYGSTPVQYTETKVYSKVAAASPPATCSITTPCTLRDYLQKKYGTIGALNTAWNTSGYYTTFDSAGTDVTGETCGTGNGVQTVFTCTLVNSSISPFSVAVKVAGSFQGGDCPWFQTRCNISGQSVPYTCASSGDCVGTFGGASGTTITSGYQPWAAGGQMTQADSPGSGLPQASYWFRMTWAGCVSAPSRQIGNTYLSGEPKVTISANNGAADNPPCATGVNIYMSCRVASGGATKGCAAAASGIPLETLQASNVAYPGGSFTVPNSGLVSGAALPNAPSIIDYHTGAVQLTFSSPPANGAAVTLDYTYGGWMFGTGLMDEDGRHTTWLGTNPICLTLAQGSIQGDEDWVCNGINEPVANANQTFAADLDIWNTQWSAQYFKTVRDAVKAAGPNTLYMGTDTGGDWGTPARKEVIQGMAPYVDVSFWLWFANQTDTTIGTAQYQYASRWFGDKPMLNFVTLHAQPDSAMAGNSSSDCCFGLSTQQGRAAQWNTMLTQELNQLSYNNTYQWVGAVWWGEYDYLNEGINWGLKTPSDNAYDAHDAVSTPVTCSVPLDAYICGSEPAPSSPGVRPFGDLLTSVKTTNSLWYGFIPPPPSGGKKSNGKIIKTGKGIF